MVKNTFLTSFPVIVIYHKVLFTIEELIFHDSMVNSLVLLLQNDISSNLCTIYKSFLLLSIVKISYSLFFIPFKLNFSHNQWYKTKWLPISYHLKLTYPNSNGKQSFSRTSRLLRPVVGTFTFAVLRVGGASHLATPRDLRRSVVIALAWLRDCLGTSSRNSLRAGLALRA